MSTPPRLTRKQLVEYPNEQGYPVTLHKLNKAAARKEIRPDALWGPVNLYTPATGVRWAKANLRLPSAA
jgi:hypothetical protein